MGKAISTSVKKQLEAQKQAMQERLAGLGEGSSFERITAKNNMFVLPDERKFISEMPVVVLDWAYHFNYYSKPYVEGESSFPDCFAVGQTMSDMRPSQNSPNIQNDGNPCATCWANQFESAPNGKAKACQNRIALAVRPYEEDGHENNIMILSVSPSALKNWGRYNRMLTEKGLVPGQVVTMVTFDTSVSYTKLDFSADRKLTSQYHKNEEIELYLQDVAEATKILLTEPKPPEDEE